MKPAAVLEILEATAAQLGVRVSYEPLATTGLGVGNHGGLCRVKGELRAIIDKRATPQERVVTLATALARLDTSGLRLNPKIRDLLHFYADRSSTKVRSPAPSGLGQRPTPVRSAQLVRPATAA